MNNYINAHEWIRVTYHDEQFYPFIHHFINDRDNRIYFLQFRKTQNIQGILLMYREQNEIYIHPSLFNYFKEWMRIYISIQKINEATIHKKLTTSSINKKDIEWNQFIKSENKN